MIADLQSYDIAAKPQAEENFDLLPKATAEELVLDNLSMVSRIALDYQGCGLPLNDLISEGNIGLMRAAQLFDPARNVRFSYYAGPWVRVHMQRALSYQAWPVNLPADYNSKRAKVKLAEERLCSQLNREPADTEVAGEAGVGLRAVRHFRTTSSPQFFSLESSRWDEEESPLQEILADPSMPTPLEQVEARSDREFIEELLVCLTGCEKRVMRLRYGLDDGCARTLDEVAQCLGYVRQGIHRLEQSALKKLRQHVRFVQTMDVVQE